MAIGGAVAVVRVDGVVRWVVRGVDVGSVMGVAIVAVMVVGVRVDVGDADAGVESAAVALASEGSAA